MYERTVERAAASLPQSTRHALFSISGGRVLITSLVGEVTTAVQNQANDAYLYLYNGSTQQTQLSGQMSFSNLAVETLVSGASGPATVVDPELSVGRVVFPSSRTIELSCSASNTGQIKWILTYSPLDPGAKVTAA